MRARPLLTLLLSICAISGPALAQRAKPAWYSGFEGGFPGEWLSWDDGSFSASGTVNAGFAEAWAIVSEAEIVYAGKRVYKGWPVRPKSDSHRAYPVIHVDIPTPLVNSFMVYLDVDYASMSNKDWVHLATWGNNPNWAVHTLSVRAGKLEMAHIAWRHIGPGEEQEFPLRRWVRLTAYIHYNGGNGSVRLWQDGVPVLEGTYSAVAGRNLMRAHWGWYSSGSLAKGVQYNDEIQIWTLDEPLRDLASEPASPYVSRDVGTTHPGEPAGRPGASSGSAGSSTANRAEHSISTAESAAAGRASARLGNPSAAGFGSGLQTGVHASGGASGAAPGTTAGFRATDTSDGNRTTLGTSEPSGCSLPAKTRSFGGAWITIFSAVALIRLRAWRRSGSALFRPKLFFRPVFVPGRRARHSNPPRSEGA